MEYKSNLNKNKTVDIKKAKILVTGGSGSLGRNIIKNLLSRGAKSIISISRDENLIKEAEGEVGSSKVQFKLGDVTDIQLVSQVMEDVDVVFHTAALKHVTLAEQNPREAYRVNILGLLNLLNNSKKVKRFIHISSDKVIGVVNCYGATKLLAEYLVRESNDLSECRYIIVRLPNFIGSRGSVLEQWRRQLVVNNTIKITDPEMTRYFISLKDGAEFIVDLGFSNKIDVMKTYYPLKFTKKFLLKDLADAFIKVYGNSKTKIQIVGAFPGEKKHEDYIEDVGLVTPVDLEKFIQT